MITYKKFIRFVINTENHKHGEKIKALNVIMKIYDDGVYSHTQIPYIFAGENQIELDIPGENYQAYIPLRHFQYDSVTDTIIKKNVEDIVILEEERDTDKLARKTVKELMKLEIKDAKEVLRDVLAKDKDKIIAIEDILLRISILEED